MRKNYVLTGSLMCCLLLTVGVGSGGAQKGAEQPDPKAEAQEQAFDQLSMALDLIGYARKHKSPLALVTAVEILYQTPTAEIKDGIEGGEPGKVEPEAARLANLLAEAQKMRPTDKHLAALIDDLKETIKESPRPIVPEIGKPPIFTRKFSKSFSFSRTFAPPNGRLTVSTVPGAGLFMDDKIRVVVKRGNQVVRNQVLSFTFANPKKTVFFSVPTSGLYRFEITNLKSNQPLLMFNMIQ